MRDPFPTRDHGLVYAIDVRSVGRERELYAAAKAGEFERLRPGAYRLSLPAEPEVSLAERDRTRYLMMVRAAAAQLDRPVFTAHSAIALAGLPILGPWPNEVYVLSRDGTASRRRGVVAIARTTDVPTTSTGDVLTTAIEFSLIQVARRAPFEDALTAADAALHASRWGGALPLTTLARLRAEHERLLPFPGSRRTEEVLRRSTDGAATPLETLSRIVIEEFGFPEPILQHRLWLPELQRSAFLDFWWPEHEVAAEADGRGKYLGNSQVATSVPRGAADAATFAAKAVIDEKHREDAIRRQVRGFARWNWAEAVRRQPIDRYLTAAGLPRTRRPRRLLTQK
ncbi:hypothetical protein ACFQ58_00130 [Agromyces sp. NPDC056523]|uniref:hypothetical protein n=1 Tax=Agromyces sp. NPDC056523 TaxID=3345850 RepID=UPI0036717EA0